MDNLIMELPDMMKDVHQKAYRQGMRKAAEKIRQLIEDQYSGNGAMNDGIDIAIGVVDNYMKEIDDEG